MSKTRPDDMVFYAPDLEEAGLTKRELFAAMAMQGILAADRDASFTSTAFDAARYADALIAELAKVPK